MRSSLARRLHGQARERGRDVTDPDPSLRDFPRARGRGVIGRNDIPETAVTSTTAPGVTHRFTSLKAFADEIAEARIWAGFHYRFSTKVGRDMGEKIGAYVAANLMQPSRR